MQNTLEARWFLKGTPPTAVQHWFQSECPGELLTTEAETREDLYAYGDLKNCLNKSKKFAPNFTYDQINLKLREGNLELKLRQKQFSTQITAENDCAYQPPNKDFNRIYSANRRHRSMWSGRVEQWCKFNSQQIKDAALDLDLSEFNWIRVGKKRSQKSDRGVESELTLVQVEDSAWWSIAFEMTTESNNAGANFFCEVVDSRSQNLLRTKFIGC